MGTMIYSDYAWTIAKASLISWLVYMAIKLWQRKPFEPLPVIGHLHAFAFTTRTGRHQWLLDASAHFQGKSYPLDVPLLGKGWVIEDPALLKYVLSTKHSSFGKGEFFTSKTRDLFGQGILLVSGDAWQAQRTAGHVFVSGSNLADFVVKTLPRHLASLTVPLDHACESGKAIDLAHLCLEYTMAVFADLAYDTDSTQLKDFVGPFDRAAAGIDNRFVNPAWRLLEHFLPYGKRLRADLYTVHRFGQQLARQMRGEIEAEEDGTKDITQGRGLFVRELRKIVPDWNDQQVSDACLNFLSAGRDTTGQTAGWVFYRLLRHPEWKLQIQEEVDALNHTPTYAELTPPSSTLPKLNAFISEVLRLHPAVPSEVVESITNETLILPDGSIVQPGDKILYTPLVMAQSPRIWGDDAGTFDPSRFIMGDPRAAAANKKTAFEWPVFNAGPRSCLGKNLARAEIAYVLVEVLKRYELHEGWGGGEKEIGPGLTSPIKGGLGVYVQRR